MNHDTDDLRVSKEVILALFVAILALWPAGNASSDSCEATLKSASASLSEQTGIAEWHISGECNDWCLCCAETYFKADIPGGKCSNLDSAPTYVVEDYPAFCGRICAGEASRGSSVQVFGGRSCQGGLSIDEQSAGLFVFDWTPEEPALSFVEPSDPDDEDLRALRIEWSFKQDDVAGRRVVLDQLSASGHVVTSIEIPQCGGHRYTDPAGPLGKPQLYTGSCVHEFYPELETRDVRVRITACSDVTVEATAPVGPVACDDCETCPVRTSGGAGSDAANGDASFSGGFPAPDPLGVGLAEYRFTTAPKAGGLFGEGFTTLLDAKVTVDSSDPDNYYEVDTGGAKRYMFNASGVQTWPSNGHAASLTPIKNGYLFEKGGSDRQLFFDLDSGRLRSIADATGGGLIDIVWDDGFPVEVRRTQGGVTTTDWSLERAPDSRFDLVGRIATTTNAITLTYDADVSSVVVSRPRLTTIAVEGEGSIRAFLYEDASHPDHMTTVEDGVGHTVATFTYDVVTGRVTSMRTPTEQLQHIDYHPSTTARDPKIDKGEHVRTITDGGGVTTEYYIRPVGPNIWESSAPLRVVEIRGTCGCAGAGNFAAHVVDDVGRVIRRQDARGFVHEFDYDAQNRLIAERRGYAPIVQNCVHAPDDFDAPQYCWVDDVDMLAAMDLSLETPASRTTYAYDDPNHPFRPTSICRPSVMPGHEGDDTCQAFTLDPATGTPTASSTTGWIWDHDTDAAIPTTRTTSSVLYDGVEPAAFDPTVEAGVLGVTLQFAWAGLAQPGGFVKQLDGPLAPGVADDTSELVYYPFDASVPPRLRGRLAARRDPTGVTAFYDDYNGLGNPTRIIDPRGVATEMTYDGLGRLTTRTVKANCNPAFGFDLEPHCDQDLTWNYDYDGTGPNVTVTGPDGNRSRQEFEAGWGLPQFHLRGSSTVWPERMEYGPADPASGAPLWQEVQEEVGGAWITRQRSESVFDGLGRLWQAIHPRSDGDPEPPTEEYAYDPAGNLLLHADPNHWNATQPVWNTRYVYDALGRLERVEQLAETAPTARWIATEYGYDLHGNLIEVTDANGITTTYRVDDLGQTYEIDSPVTGTTGTTYDDAGRVVERIDARGAEQTVTYDDAGRVTAEHAVHNGATEQTTYVYGHGVLLSAEHIDAYDKSWRQDWLGATRLGPPSEYRLVYQGQIAERWVLSYDLGGSLAKIDRVTSGPCAESTTYANDWAGRPSTVTFSPSDCGPPLTVASDVVYEPFGPWRSMSRVGIAEQRARDLQSRLTSQWVYRDVPVKQRPDPNTLLQRSLGYDPGGNLTTVDYPWAPDHSRTYTYDDLARLTGATGMFENDPEGFTAVTYQYDDVGTRLNRTLSGKVHNRSEDYVRQTTPLGLSLPLYARVDIVDSDLGSFSDLAAHDLNGDLVEDLGARYRYSPRGMLLEQWRQPSSEHYVSYQYSADRQRTRSWRRIENSNGVTVTRVELYFGLPDGRQLFERRKDDGVVVDERSHIWLGSELLATYSSTDGLRQVVSDHIGFPVMSVDGSGTPIWEAEALPFGEVTGVITGDADDDPGLRYPGQWQDNRGGGTDLTPLFANWHRWYKPGWGGYTQADPLKYSSGVRLYTYALANPMMLVDRFGLDCGPWMPFGSEYDRPTDENVFERYADSWLTTVTLLVGGGKGRSRRTNTPGGTICCKRTSGTRYMTTVQRVQRDCDCCTSTADLAFIGQPDIEITDTEEWDSSGGGCWKTRQYGRELLSKEWIEDFDKWDLNDCFISIDVGGLCEGGGA